METAEISSWIISVVAALISLGSIRSQSRVQGTKHRPSVAKKFELGFKLGIMRGFQKGITIGGRTSESAQKVFGRGWVAC